MDKISLIEHGPKRDAPQFNVGDNVVVYTKILEADKVRIHPFEGTVISRRGSGPRASFTVRKVSFGEGVERAFPLYSPNIDHIEITRKGKIRRAKLYYLRRKIGKEAKIEEAK